jgi:HEAT repeats
VRARLLGAATFVCASVLAWNATAQAPKINAPQAVAPAGAGQPALAIGVARTPKGFELVARTCPTTTCSLAGAGALPVQPAGDATAAGSRFRVLDIGSGRHVVHVEAGTGSTRWEAILAAPLRGNQPLVIWSGITPEVPPVGAQSTDAVQVTPGTKKGTVQVLVGQVSPSLELCGRPTLLSPRLVFPKDLSLRHVKLQRLAASERATAEKLTASPTEEDVTPLGDLLVAVGASSAVGSPGALTDGDPNSAWSEGRGKEGRGEFVVMRAPSEVPITSLTFVARPPTAQVDNGTAPRSFFLAANGRLLRIELPQDAWQRPGSRFEVQLAQPLNTSCLAVVLDNAHLAARAKDTRVTLAEVTAYTAFDGTESHASLADALGGDADRANAAAAVLLRGGKPAFVAVASKLATLNEAGRHRAMQVLDGAPCSVSSPVFASLLASDVALERTHAQSRIQRCGRASADALAEVVTHGAGCAPSYLDAARCEHTKSQEKPYHIDPGRLAAANELASIAPARVVPLIAPLLGQSNRPTRRELRRYLARATKKTAGRQALSEQLGNERLPVAATVDLLRAVKEHLAELHGPAGAAFSRLAGAAPDLRTRYLLLEPAAKLAAAGDGRGLSFLRAHITSDEEPMVRTQAVLLARGLATARPWVLRALEDENVRVRHAAATSLAGEDAALPYLVRRLMVDEWPMVRAASARSLATAGPSLDADRELTNRLDDPAPKVRQWSATALGARGARSAAPRLRTMADEAREKVTVRIAAVHALGRMCDAESAELLTIFAKRSTDPYSPEAASGLGTAAVAALGRLHPPDLRARLEPLLSTKGVPVQVKTAATAALANADVCR